MNTRNRQSLLPLLLALLAVVAEARTRGLSKQKPSLRERPARQAMESIVQLAERRECIPFSEVNNISTEARYAQLSEGCSPEACSGLTSCCRVLGSGLVCDADNTYPFSACVCNDFTRTRSPTPSPDSTPPAPTDDNNGTNGSTGGGDNGSTGGGDDGSTGGNTGGNTGGSTGGSTGGNTGGSTGDNTGGNTGDNTGDNTGGNTVGNTGGSTGDNPGGNTGDAADDGNTDNNTNTDTSGGDIDGAFNQINKEAEAILEDDDEWWMDPYLMGGVGAGVLVLCVGVLLLTHKFKKETKRHSRPAKSLASEADRPNSRRLEQHIELESVQSDYEMNEPPPQDEELSQSQQFQSQQQQNNDKCCQVQACNDFGSWMDNMCAPKRARSYDTKNTEDL